MSQDLLERFSDAVFVQETIKQINKDLNGLTEHQQTIHYFPETESQLENITTQLSLIIAKLKKLSGQNLAQFVYAVDLKETEFHYFLKDERIDRFTKKIIEREALKVFIRLNYSNS